MNEGRRQAADRYRELRRRVRGEDTTAAEPVDFPLPPEQEVQGLWAAGLLGNGGVTERHGHVHIIDFGTWNRSVGPDFLRAEIELNGRRLRGDIELDPTAQDWEHHGHGANPNFDNVILHIVLTKPPAGWYTRNSSHREIPVLTIPAEAVRSALGKPAPITTACTELCREPLAAMPIEKVAGMLQSAAAYRMQLKRKLFRRKAENLGLHQAWFEAWAETLGYRLNKQAMQILARRAPLKKLGREAEAILFGTAGFLVPVLPERATDQARAYHRSLWDAWWPLREQHELSGMHTLPWVLAPIRPLNHPHRRVAALAVSALRWQELEPNFNASAAKALTKQLTALEHPYWSYHCTLPSEPLARKSALVGSSRIRDFLINHVYAVDESEPAWQTYLSLPAPELPSAVQQTAQHLFGDREDVLPLLRRCYAQQALLQIDNDFCSRHICADCLFPSQLGSWTP